MEGLKLTLIFLTIFLLQNGVVISQGPIPPPKDLSCMSEARLERKLILTQLLDLQSFLVSQFGSISALDTRLKNIERLLTTNEARTDKEIDELWKMLQDLGSKKPKDGPKSLLGREEMLTSKSGGGKDMKINSCKVNSIRSIVPDLWVLMADIQSRVEALERDSQEERVKRAEDHREVVTHLEQLHTAVNSTSSYVHFRKYENSLARRTELEMLLKDPKAIFYKGENMTGEAVGYDSSTTTYQGGCHIVDGIQSMRISQSCVRVFLGLYCHGVSRALYPKPNSGGFINFLTPELQVVRSVGPCLQNEFQLIQSQIHIY